MVLLSGWKYKTPLYDPMCGSGTLLIEAAMIARNIAPGLQRTFDYLQFPWGSSDLHEQVVQEAKTKVFDGSYQIFGSDIDGNMIPIARENARNAGVADTITFSASSLTDIQYPERAHLVTNPPYGNRLESEDLS
jgi:putative N6-adenine-specific DNA methylase